MDNLESADFEIDAKSITYSARKESLLAYKSRETEFHKQLSALFSAMEPDKEVIVTHGPNEFGKDLVIISRDNISSNARAVVVKCGDVTGKANGPIDEIQSQIKMAFDNPYSATGVDDIPTIEAIVVICGSISKNAQERIRKEFSDRIIRFVDIGTLVDLFTDYYPRVFFGGYAYDYLKQQITTMEHSHAFSNKGISLSKCFVEPTIFTSALSRKRSHQPKRKKQVKYDDLKSLLEKPGCIVIRGEAGSGKSALLRKIVIDSLLALCEETSNGKTVSSIPVYIEARSLQQFGFNANIEDAIRACLDLPSEFEIGALVVDGLDEIEITQQELLIEQAHVFSKERNIALFASTRYGDYFDKETSQWDAYDIEPMHIKQALQLCESISDSQSTVNAIRNGIEKIKGNFSLTPLSVFLLLDIVEEHQEVPASLTELFDQYTDIVLGKNDKEKGIRVVFEYVMKKRLLAFIAHECFIAKDTDSIAIEHFESYAKQYFHDYDWPMDNWNDLVTEIKRSCLLVIDETTHEVRFKHKTFLEFFSAFHLYINPDDLDVMSVAIDYYFNQQWTDVAFYYFGLKKTLTKSALDSIFGREDNSPFALSKKMLVGRLLQAAWHSKTEIKRTGLEKASSYAPEIRSSFLEFANKELPDAPKIIADMVLISFAGESFGSVFLCPQICQLLKDCSPANEDDFLAALCLFVGSSKLMTPQNRENFAKRLMSELEGCSNKELELRGMIYLACAGEKDDAIQKLIKRRIKTFGKKHQELMKGILPQLPR